MIAIELARALEKMGKTGRILLLDGSPALMNAIFQTQFTDEQFVYDGILHFVAAHALPIDKLATLRDGLKECRTSESKANRFVEVAKGCTQFSENFIRHMLDGIVNRVLSINSSIDNARIRSPVMLVRPTTPLISHIAEDYDLSKCTEGPVTIVHLEGDHKSVLINPKLVEIINEYFN